MNPEYQSLCILAAVAITTTLLGVSADGKSGVLDWISLVSLTLLVERLIVAFGGRLPF